MQHVLSLQTFENKFVISIDKSAVEQDFLHRIMNRIRLEYLAKSVDFDDTIENLGEEIKADWWNNNKDRLLAHEK